jgi:hypothetical protein
MTGGWKAEENQTQVSLGFPPALEIAPAMPTFPPPRPLLDSFETLKRKEKFSAIASDRSRLIFGLENTRIGARVVKSKSVAAIFCHF